MIKAWRIVKERQKTTAFTGQGCQYTSGRWHHLMVPIVYCSDSLALTALVSFVHFQENGKHIKFISFEVRIPASLILEIESITRLPKGWRSQPPKAITKKMGSDWVMSSVSAVLSVPSAIIPIGRNYLINPHHVDFQKITITKPERFSFDSRLWK